MISRSSLGFFFVLLQFCMLRRDQHWHRSMSIRRFQPQSRNCSICRDRSWQHAMLGLAPSKASSLFLLQERIAHVRRTSFKLLAHATQHNIYRSPSQRRSKPSLLFLLLEVEELNLFHGIRSLLLLLLLFTFCWWCCAQWSCQLLLHHCDHRQRTKMANCQSFKKSCWH